MSKNHEFRLELQGQDLHLWIYGTIGGFWEGITADEVRHELSSYQDVKTIVAHIHSRGGSAWDGFAIYNLLKSHSATVRVIVEGMAASAASIVAMAGDEIEMHANSMMMIHQSIGGVYGNVEELKSYIPLLEKVDGQVVAMYAARTGKENQQIEEWLAAETYFTAEEAVSEGFADRIIANKSKEGTVPSNKQDAAKEIASVIRKQMFPQSLLQEMSLMTDTKTGTPPEQAATVSADVLAKIKEELRTEMKAEIEASLNQGRQEGATVEQKRQTEIRALCDAAGLPEKADAYCNDPKCDAATVRGYLFEALCKKNTAPVGDNRETETVQTPQAEQEKKLKLEYAAEKEVFEEMGITEADYIASRKKD